MMRKLLFSFAAGIVLATAASAQFQPNNFFASLNVNGATSPPPTAPSIVSVFTDSQVNLNVKAFPAGPTPVVVLFATSFASGGSRQAGAVSGFGFQIDLPDQGSAGYSDQEFVNGYTLPGSLSYANATGDLTIPVTIPACVVVNNVATCITQSTFEVSGQALVVDFTNSPFNIRSTGVGTGAFTNGYMPFTLVGDGFGTFNFLGGFIFNFYGTAYTRAFVSANGFVSFGGTGAPTGFPDPNVADIRGGPPRIMSFYNDLVPETPTFMPRIYAQQFVEAGPGGAPVRKIKFVHERLAEFGNATGPHGGEIVITEAGDVAVFVHSYNATPSINTAVGITPGNNVGPTGPTAFGWDLSVLSNSGPSVLGAGAGGWELFNHGVNPTTHPIDLIGFHLTNGSGVGRGVVYFKDISLPGTTPANSGYIVQ